MQVDAGGDWADWGGSASEFGAGWGTPSPINLNARRERGEWVFNGYFALGTASASPATLKIPHGLSADTTLMLDKKYKYGNFHQVVSSAAYAIWAGGNASGVMFYCAASGADLIQFTTVTESWCFLPSNVSSIFGSSQGVWVEGRVPISGWKLG
jgi:hypothetical protein